MAVLLRGVSSPSASGVERLAAVDGDVERHLRLVPGSGAAVLDPEGQGDFLAEDGEGGGVADDEAAVPVLGLSGQQQMQRRGQVRRLVEVVQAPVGQQDHPGDAGARFLGQRIGQGGHQAGAGVALAIGEGHTADLGIGAGGDAGGQRLGCGPGLRGAVREALRGGAVLDQQHDVGERAAVLLPPGGAGKGGEDHGGGQPAQGPARKPAPDGKGDARQRQRGQRGDQRPGQERREDHRSGHWPSLSRSAGTWTWSDL